MERHKDIVGQDGSDTKIIQTDRIRSQCQDATPLVRFVNLAVRWRAPKRGKRDLDQKLFSG